MTSIVLQISIAWLYSHIAEYCIHRWLLHKFAIKKGKIFSFHWRGHHKEARINNFKDNAYFGHPFKINSAGKELFYLVCVIILHAPLYLYFPWAFLTLCYSTASYYYIHRKSHRNPEWAAENLPWHYAHHMAMNQNANFGVRSDLIDRIAGTRERIR